MLKMHKSLSSLSLGLGLTVALGLMGCNSASEETPNPDAGTAAPDLSTLSTPGGTGPVNAFNHDDILSAIGDVFADGRQVPAEVGERMHAQIAGAELLRMPHGTHTSLFEHHEEIGAAIAGFLGRRLSSRP